MNEKQQTPHNQDDLSPQEQTTQPVPIEVKWNLPAWMLKDQGPLIEVPDDDIDFQ